LKFCLLSGRGHDLRRVAGLYAASVAVTIVALTAANAAVPHKLRMSDAVFGAARPIPAPAAAAAAAAPTPPPPVAAIAFVSPVPGEAVDSPFGLRRLPWEARGRLHAGVDFAAPNGAPVRATATGVVLKAGKSPSYGHFVQIAHAGGLTSMYAHMGSQAAGLGHGARVAAGQVIGFVGNTGRSTGSHLHFELRKGDKPLDPALFLERSFARLKDLPIGKAGRVSRTVRVAFVSRWPEGVTSPADKAQAGDKAAIIRAARAGGRVRATLQAADSGQDGVIRTAQAGGRIYARLQAAQPPESKAAAPLQLTVPAPALAAATSSAAAIGD
jgi:peptidase M23-like protein